MDLMTIPESGRADTLRIALEALESLTVERPLIVEVGTTRNTSPAACHGDGWATRVFGWYASQRDGMVISIDRDPTAIAAARTVTSPYQAFVDLRTGDALPILSTIEREVHLLYLDGPDDSEFHVRAFNALGQRPPLVLVDDVLDEQFGIKGRVLIPQLLSDGYELVFKTVGRQGQALVHRPAGGGGSQKSHT